MGTEEREETGHETRREDSLQDLRAASRALTLRERAERLRSGSPDLSSPAAASSADPSPTAAPPSEAARRRLDRWRSQSPFDRIGLAPRLEAEGLSRSEFEGAVTVPPWTLAGSAPPAWWRRLLGAYEQTPPPASTFEPPPDAGPAGALLEILHPPVCEAREELSRRLDSLGGELPFDPRAAVEPLAAGLPLRLFHLTVRTLVLELHVARVQDRLTGESPEERFASFVASLRQPAAVRELFREYPVLGRRTMQTLERWVETSAESMGRLAADWEELTARGLVPSRGETGAPVEIRSAGDTHRRGRAVALLRFEDGSRLVYKPRSLAVDRHFQELLGWLSERGFEASWRTLQVLDRGTHGWMEHVASEPCRDLDAAGRYHLRLGGLLAVLHALDATDCHFENLIAAGEHPVLVDLETLFHPHPPPPTDQIPELAFLSDALGDSVLQVGLLPFRVGVGDGFAGADISGLGRLEGVLTPDPVPQLEASGTDRMQFVRRRLEMPAGRNRVRLEGGPVDPLDFATEMEEGFARVYRLLAEHRRALAAPDGPLERFSGDPVRAVLRATRGYHLLLYDSHHPDLLRDALDRDLFLDRLWVGLETRPHLQRVVAHEHRDLVGGDIPFFTARPGSTEVGTSRGETVGDFFAEPSLARVRRRLGRLGEEDLDRQLWLLRTSLSTLVLERDHIPWPSWTPDAEEGEALTDLSAAALEAARRVGRRLAELAVHPQGDGAGSGSAWLGLEYRQGRWALAPVAEDLYSGAPGILLFLAQLGHAGRDPWATELAADGLETLWKVLENEGENVETIGAFQGWGGLLYTWTQLAALGRLGAGRAGSGSGGGELDGPGSTLAAKVERLEAAASEAVERIAGLLADDVVHDLVAGAAGALAALLAWARSRAGAGARERALEVARACGESLVAAALPAPGGLAWHGQVPADQPPTGFSHGASGIGWALAELAAETGDERFAEAARAGFAYERTRFVPELGNWLDPQDPDKGERPRQGGEKATSLAWCYGAPGIGLARLPSVARGEGGEIQADLEAAVEATFRHRVGFNHSLCHGDLGNLELLRSAAGVLDRPELAEEVERRGRLIVGGLGRVGPLCGTPMGSETPGLMNGLAGIGYGLLRLAAPERVPSVLTLEAPVVSESTGSAG